jgi:glycosyltransferase involved in cell wall biosynthesis
MKPKYSVIVPTYNHLEDCLKPCLESFKIHTDLEEIEILVVANGCKDGTAEYIDSLGYPFKLLWFDEGLGFAKAVNEGVKVAQGEYIIILNNDVMFLDKGLPKNAWIKMLEEPFKDEKMGITGPLKLFDRYADSEVMIFFLVMIKKELFDKIGLLDESFWSGGEDIDFCVKAVQAGYKQVQVPYQDLTFTFTNVGFLPVYHKGEGTLSKEEFPEYGNRIIKENGLKNMVKYNKHIKLNLGSGGVEVPGYISVDKYDERANLIMDVLDIDKYFAENSVEEILASHLFEHINPYDSVETLVKWRKILKQGGKLIMEVPNIEELCKDFVVAGKEERYGILNCIYGSVNTKAGGDKSEITSPHLWGWFPEMLCDHLVWAGYTNIVWGPEQIPHPHKNFRVEATKPL